MLNHLSSSQKNIPVFLRFCLLLVALNQKERVESLGGEEGLRWTGLVFFSVIEKIVMEISFITIGRSDDSSD